MATGSADNPGPSNVEQRMCNLSSTPEGNGKHRNLVSVPGTDSVQGAMPAVDDHGGAIGNDRQDARGDQNAKEEPLYNEDREENEENINICVRRGNITPPPSSAQSGHPQEELEDILEGGLEFNGAVSFSRTYPTAPNPILDVEGLGTVGLPLGLRDAAAIKACAEQAPFGMVDQIVIDKTVRDTWEIDGYKVFS